MVSIAVVGPPMSGKTHLCVMLAGLPTTSRSVYNETCGVHYLKSDIDSVPWHIWDTPSYTSTGWPGAHTASEAQVVVVCHDGRRLENPCEIVRKLGVDKCIIALTCTPLASTDLSYAMDYLSTTTRYGGLVPVVLAVHTVGRLISAIQSVASRLQVDSATPVEYGTQFG